MDYEEIIKWCKDKIEHEKVMESYKIESDLFPISVFNPHIDAVRELVLESCDTTAKTSMSEVNIINNEDMLALKKKYDKLKSDMNDAFECLQKIYDRTMHFSNQIKCGISEIKSGRKSILDLEEEIQYSYPQTYDFKQCSEILGRCLENNFKGM